jgi:uncharacterized protein YqcC (DUF446 family)
MSQGKCGIIAVVPPPHAAVAAALDEVEAALHQAGFWQDDPPPPEAFDFHEAFARDTMAYSQWLQFVFIPNARRLAEEGGEFPATSQVGAQAIREFDGAPHADVVIDRLTEFDALFD